MVRHYDFAAVAPFVLIDRADDRCREVQEIMCVNNVRILILQKFQSIGIVSFAVQ
jgi:hypothetical protein